MGNRRTGLGDGEAAWTSSRTIRLVCMPALIGFVTAMIMVTMMTAYSSAATEMGVLKTTHAMFTEMFQRTTRKHALFGPSLHRPSSQDEQSEVVEEETVESDDAWLKDTAIVTLAAGDTSGKNAVALMKSLRDAGTKVPNLVVLLSRGGLGSDDCNNNEWRVKNKRVHIACQHLDTIAPEIISQRYLDDFDAMGVQYYPVNPIPDTDYTIIPGGRQFFWGMAFNKVSKLDHCMIVECDCLPILSPACGQGRAQCWLSSPQFSLTCCCGSPYISPSHLSLIRSLTSRLSLSLSLCSYWFST